MTAACAPLRRLPLDPAPLGHAAVAGFREGYVANAGAQVAIERRAGDEMAGEFLPTRAIGIDQRPFRRNLAPAIAVVEVEIAVEAEISNLWGLSLGLHVAAMQPGDRGRLRAVDLEHQQIVAAHARRPRAEDGAEHAALELDQRGGAVVDVDRIVHATLIDAFGNRGR